MTLRLIVTPSSGQVTAPASVRPATCTCDARFYPTALDVDCPDHGLAAFLRDQAESILGWES